MIVQMSRNASCTTQSQRDILESPRLGEEQSGYEATDVRSHGG